VYAHSGIPKETGMSSTTPYSINLDTRFGPLEEMDIQSIVDACSVPWFNQTLCRVNDCVLRLGIFHGEFHWHKHDEEDEVFYVIDGTLLIDLEDRLVELGPGQGIMVPRGVLHRTRAPERVIALMIEGAGVVPTGD
jgi:mannose-6-phosphate isomerase-like protein (cupin superfamily)